MSEVGHVTRLTHGDKEILLVGTAHVSQKSVEEVERVIREERPDTVCVELDEGRYKMLTDDSAWRSLDIVQVIKQKRVLFLLSSLALGAYQRRMGEKLGVRPGAELLAAVRAAEEVGAHVVLADRDVQATLKRTWSNLGFWDRSQIVSGLLAAPFAVDDIDESKVEELKDKDTIGEMMHAVAREMPRIKVPLIDERDQFLMSKIQEAPGRKIVGVVATAGGGSGEMALSGLQTIGRALHSWVVPQQAVISKARHLFSDDGILTDDKLETRLLDVGRQVARFAYLHHAQQSREFLQLWEDSLRRTAGV